MYIQSISTLNIFPRLLLRLQNLKLSRVLWFVVGLSLLDNRLTSSIKKYQINCNIQMKRFHLWETNESVSVEWLILLVFFCSDLIKILILSILKLTMSFVRLVSTMRYKNHFQIEVETVWLKSATANTTEGMMNMENASSVPNLTIVFQVNEN